MAITRLGGANAITGTIPTSVAPGKGKVLQVVSTTKTDTFGVTATATKTAVTGLTVNITPSSSSNKIFVMVSLAVGNNESQNSTRGRITRTVGGTETLLDEGASAGTRDTASFDIYQNNGNHQEKVSMTFLDSPSSTAQCTYGVKINASGSSGDILVNRARTDASDGLDRVRTSSTITVMEVSA